MPLTPFHSLMEFPQEKFNLDPAMLVDSIKFLFELSQMDHPGMYLEAELDNHLLIPLLLFLEKDPSLFHTEFLPEPVANNSATAICWLNLLEKRIIQQLSIKN